MSTRKSSSSPIRKPIVYKGKSHSFSYSSTNEMVYATLVLPRNSTRTETLITMLSSVMNDDLTAKMNDFSMSENVIPTFNLPDPLMQSDNTFKRTKTLSHLENYPLFRYPTPPFVPNQQELSGRNTVSREESLSHTVNHSGQENTLQSTATQSTMERNMEQLVNNLMDSPTMTMKEPWF